MSSELVDKKCDVCSKPLSAHSYGSGVPICPGIYAPGFRSTLHDRIEQLEREVARKDEALRRLLGACEIAAVMPKTIGKAWVPTMDSPELEQARTALHKKDDE